MKISDLTTARLDEVVAPVAVVVSNRVDKFVRKTLKSNAKGLKMYKKFLEDCKNNFASVESRSTTINAFVRVGSAGVVKPLRYHVDHGVLIAIITLTNYGSGPIVHVHAIGAHGIEEVSSFESLKKQITADLTTRSDYSS